MKRKKTLLILIILLLHFLIKFKIGEPYPGLVLPSFSSTGGNSNYYKISKINYTFYNTDNDSLTVLPNEVYLNLPPRFARHYTSLLWSRKNTAQGFTQEEEKKISAYLFERGSTLWDLQKTVSHIVLSKNQFTYAKNNPRRAIKKEILQQWRIDRPQQN